jgi:hypothetical protein
MVQNRSSANGAGQRVDAEVTIRVAGVYGVPHRPSGPCKQKAIVIIEELVSHYKISALLNDMKTRQILTTSNQSQENEDERIWGEGGEKYLSKA